MAQTRNGSRAQYEFLAKKRRKKTLAEETTRCRRVSRLHIVENTAEEVAWESGCEERRGGRDVTK